MNAPAAATLHGPPRGPRRGFCGHRRVARGHCRASRRKASVIGVRDLQDGAVSARDALDTVGFSDPARADTYAVRPHDVLVTGRGTLLKFGLVGEETVGANREREHHRCAARARRRSAARSLRSCRVKYFARKSRCCAGARRRCCPSRQRTSPNSKSTCRRWTSKPASRPWSATRRSPTAPPSRPPKFAGRSPGVWSMRGYSGEKHKD